MNITVTYFEPFGGRTFNASKATAEGLNLDVNLFGLPVSWNDINQRLDEIFIDEPDYLFLLGEAARIGEPRLELEAHNKANGNDNYGVDKINEKVLPDGLDTLNTTFITDDMFLNSFDPGTYLCNCSYYLSLTKARNTKVIYIHVPAFNEGDEENKNHCVEVVEAMINHLVEMN